MPAQQQERIRQKQRLIDKLDQTAFARNHIEVWKFIKFMIAGFFAAMPELVVQMFLVYLFTKLQVNSLPNFFFFDFIAGTIPPREGIPLAALVYAFLFSTCVGQTLGFILGRKVAFHANSNVALSAFLQFMLAVLTIVLNGILGPAITGLFSKVSFLPEFWVQLFSKLVSMASGVLWIYPASRFIIHRRVKEKEVA